MTGGELAVTMRHRARGLMFAAIIAVGASALANAQPAHAAPPVQVGPVQVDVFQGGGGSFPASQPPGVYAFSGQYANLTFNPANNPPGPYGNAGICSSGGTVDYQNNRPFDYVDPFTCVAQHVQNADAKEQAGASTTLMNLTAFYAEFTSSFTVAAAGDVTFNSFPDDGQLIGIGADTAGHQPTSTQACGGSTMKWSYNLQECSANSGHVANEVDFTVHFPAAGTYPVEIDYAENGSAGLVMTVEANHAPMPETSTTFPWPTATVAPVTADIFTNTSNSSTFTTPGAGTFAFTAGPFGNFSFDPPNNPPATDDGVGNANICSQGETVTYDANRPLDYVDPATCTLTPVQNSTATQQAGSGALNAFQAELTSSITVSGPGDIPFTTDPDDGIQVGIGKNAGGDQPTTSENCSGTTPKQSDAIIDCTFNTSHYASEHDFLVHFPAAGTYPIEIDWAENGSADLSLNLELNHNVLPPQPVAQTPDGPVLGLGVMGALVLTAAGLVRWRVRRSTETASATP